jgi:hypothetical protein
MVSPCLQSNLLLIFSGLTQEMTRLVLDLLYSSPSKSPESPLSLRLRRSRSDRTAIPDDVSLANGLCWREISPRRNRIVYSMCPSSSFQTFLPVCSSSFCTNVLLRFALVSASEINLIKNGPFLPRWARPLQAGRLESYVIIKRWPFYRRIVCHIPIFFRFHDLALHPLRECVKSRFIKTHIAKLK